MGYIYRITHKESFKSYIGQTITSLEKRWKEHVKSGSKCRYLSHALKKYGENAFELKLICICFDEDLDRFEQEYIKKYNTLAPNGYNLREGGNGGKLHQDTKNKISDTLKDKYAKQKIKPTKAFLGKKLTAEHRAKISQSGRGLIRSEGTVRKITENSKKYIVLQYTSEGILICTHDGCVEAAKHVNVSKTEISQVCRGKRKSLKGFNWKYADRITNEIVLFENNIKI